MRRVKQGLPALVLYVVSASCNADALEPLNVGSVLQVVVGLLAVLLLFGVVAYFLQRFSGIKRKTGSSMRIVDGLSLSTRDRIVLVDVEGTHILLGISPGSIRALHILGHGEVHKDGAGVPSEFQQQLSAVQEPQ